MFASSTASTAVAAELEGGRAVIGDDVGKSAADVVGFDVIGVTVEGFAVVGVTIAVVDGLAVVGFLDVAIDVGLLVRV